MLEPIQTNPRIFCLTRQLVMAVFAVVFVLPASAQQSFFNKYIGPQPVSGGTISNAGITPDSLAYYFTSRNYLLETDPDGHVRWGRNFTYNNLAVDLIALEERAAGGYYGAGFATDQLVPQYINFIFRLDSAGNTIWTKEVQFGYAYAHLIRIATTTDGGLALCATTTMINNQSGVWVGKTDSLGNLLWGKIIRDSLNVTRGSAIAPTRDGGVIVTSKINVLNSNDLCTGLSRLDANGNLLWTKTLSGAGSNDWPMATQSTDGGFAIAGSGLSGNNEGFRLCRTDSLGNLLWSTLYFNLPDYYYAHKIQETADHGFILAGCSMNANTLVIEPVLIRTDSMGDTLWARKIIFTNYCGARAWDVQETPDGGILIPVSDLKLIKTDPNGDISCVSFPVSITVLDTFATQHSSLYFVNGATVVQATISNTLIPLTDSTICAGEFSPTEVTEHDASDILAVFPNPSEGLFTLQFENGNSSYNVVVYNAIGQVVRRYKSASSQLLIDLTAADAGIYFVRVIGDSGKHIRSVKLLKR